MKTGIVILACAALLAGTATASAHKKHYRNYVVHHRHYVVHHRIYGPVTSGRASYIDDPPGAAFQNRYIRMDNGYPAIR
jgi:hypothetical protein